MHNVLFPAIAVLALGIAVAQWRRRLALQRLDYIRTFELPKGLFDRMSSRRPGLSVEDCQLVAHALRQFFLAHAKSGRSFVSMPLQVADHLRHEFILHTRSYDAFCRKACGVFPHHTPAVPLGSDRRSNAGLRRCCWFACKEENSNPERLLPLLFAIDAKLGIADGFRYAADCNAVRRVSQSEHGGAVHCGGDFSSVSFDGGTDGVGADADAGGGGDSGCAGGGCGGGGD